MFLNSFPEGGRKLSPKKSIEWRPLQRVFKLIPRRGTKTRLNSLESIVSNSRLFLNSFPEGGRKQLHRSKKQTQICLVFKLIPRRGTKTKRNRYFIKRFRWIWFLNSFPEGGRKPAVGENLSVFLICQFLNSFPEGGRKLLWRKT